MNLKAKSTFSIRITAVLLAIAIVICFTPVSNAVWTDKISSTFTGLYQYGSTDQKISIHKTYVTFNNVTKLTYYDSERKIYSYPKGTWDVVNYHSNGEAGGNYAYYSAKLKDRKNGHHTMHIFLHYSAVKSKRHVSNGTSFGTGTCFYMKEKY